MASQRSVVRAASARLEVRRVGDEQAWVRANGAKVWKSIPKVGYKRSLGRVGGEEGRWCADAGEDVGGKGEVGRHLLCLSILRRKKKVTRKKKIRERKKRIC